MPLDLLTLSAALLAGVMGGVHCAAMCGGVAAGIAAGSVPNPPLRIALLANLGRIIGYSLAGAVVGGFGAGLLALFRIEGLALGLRMAVGIVLILAAIRLLDSRGRLAFLAAPGALLWRTMAPLHRRLLPARTPARVFALGLLWGWLPCGLSATLLTAAWFSAEALSGAAIMAAFGLGTLPIMLPLTWSGARLATWLARRAFRVTAAAAIAGAGLLTLTAPWLARIPAVHDLLVALGCRTLPG
ncbi:MAG TPA: sulfite exporter TauE/SafE family protein [Xanthomonadales bacterium]|nr:sulfite exporter TauE/SafE family protein [Xanthomonadales bacterium]